MLEKGAPGSEHTVAPQGWKCSHNARADLRKTYAIIDASRFMSSAQYINVLLSVNTICGDGKMSAGLEIRNIWVA